MISLPFWRATTPLFNLNRFLAFSHSPLILVFHLKQIQAVVKSVHFYKHRHDFVLLIAIHLLHIVIRQSMKVGGWISRLLIENVVQDLVDLIILKAQHLRDSILLLI